MPEPVEQGRGLTEHTLRGEISRVVYVNDDGSYSVLRLCGEQGVEHTVVGNISGAFEGQGLEVTGHWESHKEFGRQLRAETFKFILPTTREGIQRYLASGMIEGIGPKISQCIVDHFGEKTLEVLDHYSARLREIPGIGKKRAEIIRDAWHAQAARRNIFIFLQGLGISSLRCQKLYEKYGDRAAHVVKENPYRLADDIGGIGFIMADRIAASLNIGKTDLYRLAAGALYSMKQLNQVGHCCYPYADFLNKCAGMLEVSNHEAELGLNKAVEENQLVVSENMVYAETLFKAEAELPGHVIRLAGAQRHYGQRLLSVPPLENQHFSHEQLEAVDRVGHYPLSIITGGPGVGKTTVVSEIVRRAKAAKLSVYLAAPTGRAAKRLSESTNFPAKTIHRMLKWQPKERCFFYNAKQQLPCQALVVDEVSMLDITLALCLFRAIKPETVVALVGDADQLPSVGPGNVLHDFLRSKIFASTCLTKIFRQGVGSRIVHNAHNVNHGIMPDVDSGESGALSDFYWIEQDDPEKVVDMIVRLATERIPARFGMKPVRDIQVLTPMNRGMCGTVFLNKKLQEKLNPGAKPQFKIGERIFKSGDKVMQTANNYDKNVFNGDMGRIGRIDQANKRFVVFYESDRIVEYEFSETDQLSPAYAVTVHKSQGSEFPAVIVPLLTQHYMMLQRNLLYTAMTRARHLLVLIGSRKAIAMAVSNNRLEPRYSLLARRLAALLKQTGRNSK